MSRHSELARELAEGIASGRFPVGSLLPTELELCERHGASRYTVRMALAELQEMGLISRRKNVGTRVEAATPSAGFTQALASVEDLAQFGSEHVRTVRKVEDVVVDLALAKEMGCAGGTRWLRISSLRMDGGRPSRPMGWTDVYVDEKYREVGEMVRSAPDTLISSLIETRFGRRIARITQDIQAMAVPKVLAEELMVEVGSPALRIVRHYLDAADEVFEISVTVHPAERFTFSMQLRRAKE
ncbi:MAG TPA: GntR family transcriptional regulator [Roseateles sp.]|nr:GntR family transcriptional regulator [Roseateles sp.]